MCVCGADRMSSNVTACSTLFSKSRFLYTLLLSLFVGVFFCLFLQYVKVIFEIGHEASVRNKRTPEGFTHDWELFVRGADNTDIHFFVDKVVFNLHDTFPNPKRGKCFLFSHC